MSSRTRPRNCPRCNASSYKAGARFCTKCGADLFPQSERSRWAFAFTLLISVWKLVRAFLLTILALLRMLLGPRTSAGNTSEPNRRVFMCPNCGGRMINYGVRSVCSSCAKELVHTWLRSGDTASDAMRHTFMCPKCGGRMHTYGNRSVCSSCAKELLHSWLRSGDTAGDAMRQGRMCPNCGGRMNNYGIRSVCSSCAKELVHTWRR
jgi:predicted amidophosphoribosyltransferase